MAKPVKDTAGASKSTKARELAIRLMTEHGLVGWQFAFNASLRRAGVCYYPARGRPGRIELSVHLAGRAAVAEVRDTILHEIAHALVGPDHGHDATWKAKCLEVGARPERCLDAVVANMPMGRWRASCPACNQQFSRHRKPKRLAGWHHRPCGPGRGSFTWVRTDDALEDALEDVRNADVGEPVTIVPAPEYPRGARGRARRV
jgi:predicted SprT family Zn-dependent metalloprotease